MKTKTKPFSQHIRSTLTIQPERHSLQISENRWLSFGYALAGLLHMIRYAKNLRIQALITLMVIVVGIWLALEPLSWAVLVLVIALNLMAEFINAAIEAVVNLASPEFHEMAQLAKDIAAGAVLLSSLTALLIGLLVFVPPLMEKFT